MSRGRPDASRLAGLDGLRALAATAVLTYHVAEWSRFTFAGSLASVFWELKGGVAVFFVISGAVLYLPYARAIRDRAPLPSWRSYARRRAVRILPAYWIALTVVAIGPFSAGVLGPQLSSYYGLSQIYAPGTLLRGLGGAWSLCVEVSFYAVLPLFARVAARVARTAGPGPGRALCRQLALIALAGLASIVLRGLLAASVPAPIQERGVLLAVALPGFLDWFAIGMGVAVLVAEREAGRAGGRATAVFSRRPGWCALLGIAAFGVGIPAEHADMFLPWYGLLTHVALGLGSGLLVLSAVLAHRRSWSGRLLRSSWLTWIGTISYGIYLWNRVVLEVISRQPRPRALPGAIVLWLVVLAGSLALGAASWYLIERPAQRALRARERAAHEGGRNPKTDRGVQPMADGLNPGGVPVDHLA